ncbi:uncharacterized protein LOC105832404 isoform X2 [Monomorium pharaonis]|uniref:uncharacterized protein LOC105832404 isoform X2 n=1 Tax=Monomorium pharaonis TaxID=307658 RepID=UPI001747BB04|nr:uncharacterized protein LOC105832404 isoform X2 [Monomorium pharaonis]
MGNPCTMKTRTRRPWWKNTRCAHSSYSRRISTHSTFGSCNPEEWIIMNITLQMINGTKMITCNITYKEADNSTGQVYRIHIMIDNYINRTVCTGEPTIWIDNINCNNQNHTESGMDVCKIANELGYMEKQTEWFQHRYGISSGDTRYNLIFCINIYNDDLSWYTS